MASCDQAANGKAPDFFLVNTECDTCRPPFRCWEVARIAANGRDDYLLVKADPPISKSGDFVLLATKHPGTTLFPVSGWPMYVYVAEATAHIIEQRSVGEERVAILNWANLWPTMEEAMVDFERVCGPAD